MPNHRARTPVTDEFKGKQTSYMTIKLYRQRHPEKRKEETKRLWQRIKNDPILREETYALLAKLGRIRRKRYRIEALQHYSNGIIKCACCGEKELCFLVLDHINNNGYAERKQLGNKRAYFYVYLKKANWPSGYQVLCMNCNWGKMMMHKETGQAVCPHTTRIREIEVPVIA